LGNAETIAHQVFDAGNIPQRIFFRPESSEHPSIRVYDIAGTLPLW
jgi:hypothetical protein